MKTSASPEVVRAALLDFPDDGRKPSRRATSALRAATCQRLLRPEETAVAVFT
jgi:hypothetical protein